MCCFCVSFFLGNRNKFWNYSKLFCWRSPNMICRRLVLSYETWLWLNYSCHTIFYSAKQKLIWNGVELSREITKLFMFKRITNLEWNAEREISQSKCKTMMLWFFFRYSYWTEVHKRDPVEMKWKHKKMWSIERIECTVHFSPSLGNEKPIHLHGLQSPDNSP